MLKFGELIFGLTYLTSLFSAVGLISSMAELIIFLLIVLVVIISRKGIFSIDKHLVLFILFVCGLRILDIFLLGYKNYYISDIFLFILLVYNITLSKEINSKFLSIVHFSIFLFLGLTLLYILIGASLFGVNFDSGSAESLLAKLNIIAFVNETTVAGLSINFLILSYGFSRLKVIFLVSFLFVIILNLIMAKMGFILGSILYIIFRLSRLFFKSVSRVYWIILLIVNIYIFFIVDLDILRSLDVFLSFRGSIWSESLNSFRSSEYFTRLFGLGRDFQPELLVPFSDVPIWENYSLHNGYLRLFITEGYIGLLVFSFGLFAIWSFIFNKFKNDHVAEDLLFLFLIFKFTDGAFFYGSVNFFELLTVLVVLKIREQFNHNGLLDKSHTNITIPQK
jgi:hypothetical protein